MRRGANLSAVKTAAAPHASNIDIEGLGLPLRPQGGAAPVAHRLHVFFFLAKLLI
jgi:hypothetical protein